MFHVVIVAVGGETKAIKEERQNGGRVRQENRVRDKPVRMGCV